MTEWFKVVNLNLIMDYPIIGSNPIFSDAILLIVNEKKKEELKVLWT